MLTDVRLSARRYEISIEFCSSSICSALSRPQNWGHTGAAGTASWRNENTNSLLLINHLCLRLCSCLRACTRTIHSSFANKPLLYLQRRPKKKHQRKEKVLRTYKVGLFKLFIFFFLSTMNL